MTITVTAKANQHLKNALAKHPDATAIRLGVKTSGCSGYAYVVDYVDEILEFDGLQLVVDPISRPLLHGTEVDLVVEGVNRTLRFHNPNVVSECGCGESFAVGAAVPV
jgi:iron-sulfur cluster assembly protein